MSIEKYVEQDFQALETSFSKGEPLSEIALPRILENISRLDDADRIFHWHEELRRIGGLPSNQVAEISIGSAADMPATLVERVIFDEPVTVTDEEREEESGGDGSLSK
jgi:hypothetical protein